MADTFDVIDIVDRTVPLGGGQYELLHRVTYRTKPSSLVGYVDIQDSTDWETSVSGIVATEAAKREQVKAL